MPRKIKGRIDYIEPLLLTVEEAAVALGVSMDVMYFLRKHPLYQHDSEAPSKTGNGKGQPRWRMDKIKFIVDARTITPDGIRRYEDDFAYQLWNRMLAQKDIAYKKKAGVA